MRLADLNVSTDHHNNLIKREILRTYLDVFIVSADKASSNLHQRVLNVARDHGIKIKIVRSKLTIFITLTI